eukprot:360045-Chlamydomonas_euryale.AAC.4
MHSSVGRHLGTQCEQGVQMAVELSPCFTGSEGQSVSYGPGKSAAGRCAEVMERVPGARSPTLQPTPAFNRDQPQQLRQPPWRRLVIEKMSVKVVCNIIFEDKW